MICTCGTGSSHEWDHCTEKFPCDEGGGDCDSSAQCKPGLRCNNGANNRRDFHGQLANKHADCCTSKLGKP